MKFPAATAGDVVKIVTGRIVVGAITVVAGWFLLR